MKSATYYCSWLTLIAISLFHVSPVCADPADYFAIEVVDSHTGRGVPMIELATVNNIVFITDSAGRIAFNEPGLMNREVFFYVRGHGYAHPKDGFGISGVRLVTTPGEVGTVKVDRVNIAERLYRITGQGIYRDSVLLGKDVPIARPTINGDVVGQDSVQAVIHRGKIWWFWGDTNRPKYPLGQFKMSGATSLLPADGGLSPGKGIDLEYFVDENGFSRKMAPIEGEGAVWLHGLFTVNDDTGKPRIVADYVRLKELSKPLEHGLAVFNDETDTFEKLSRFDEEPALYPRGHDFVTEVDGGQYIYFATPLPYIRVKADWAGAINVDQYEAFTCLKPGTATRRPTPADIERDADGKAVWAWKKGTAMVEQDVLHGWVEMKQVEESDVRGYLRSKATNKPVIAHRGSVAWNEFRGRWIMIFGEVFGKESNLGEIYFAESQMPEGPWSKPVKVVTHDGYTFYNPVHHPFFDEQGGRIIYFEGTYCNTFSKTKEQTPRYDYNQIMYRLDLGDERLKE